MPNELISVGHQFKETLKLPIIAITISTNYSDLIPFILRANTEYFKKWIFVTDINDTNTINTIPRDDKFDVLFFDFKTNNAVFNKGAAVRYAQEKAYHEFPNDWYLLIDSDICLDLSFEHVQKNLINFDKNCIYGTNNRKNYLRYEDYKHSRNGQHYDTCGIEGFFQLYHQHRFYADSTNASECDLKFTQEFTCQQRIDSVRCNHLGKNGINWDGRKSSDFLIMDSPIPKKHKHIR